MNARVETNLQTNYNKSLQKLLTSLKQAVDNSQQAWLDYQQDCYSHDITILVTALCCQICGNLVTTGLQP